MLIFRVSMHQFPSGLDGRHDISFSARMPRYLLLPGVIPAVYYSDGSRDVSVPLISRAGNSQGPHKCSAFGLGGGCTGRWRWWCVCDAVGSVAGMTTSGTSRVPRN